MDVGRDIAAVAVQDGLTFDLATTSVQEIREQAEYPGLRLRVAVSIGPWKGTAAWDVSTDDPIVPAPRRVTIDRILGDTITLLGYAPETGHRREGRHDPRTRHHQHPMAQLRRDRPTRPTRLRCGRVALIGAGRRPLPRHRPRTNSTSPSGLRRSPPSEMGAWRRKEHLESVCEADLDDQITLVANRSTRPSRTAPNSGDGRCGEQLIGNLSTMARELDRLPQAWTNRRPEVERALLSVACTTPISATMEQIEQAAGTALTATGTTMSITEILTAAETTRPMLTLFDHSGTAPLHYGRQRRTASREQRLALVAALSHRK